MKISVNVKPGSKKGPFVEVTPEDTLQVYVKEQAIDGKANNATLDLIAKHYGVSKSRVKVMSGHTSKRKIIEIDQ